MLLGKFENPLQFTDLQSFLLAVLNSAIYILFPILVLMIVYTGFLFVTAQGNAQKLEEAKRALLWTIIGSLIVLGSYAFAIALKATVCNVMTSNPPGFCS